MNRKLNQYLPSFLCSFTALPVCVFVWATTTNERSYVGVSRQGFDPGFVCIRDVPVILTISFAYFVHDLKN